MGKQLLAGKNKKVIFMSNLVSASLYVSSHGEDQRELWLA